eukprot:CFRG5523T1
MLLASKLVYLALVSLLGVVAPIASDTDINVPNTSDTDVAHVVEEAMALINEASNSRNQAVLVNIEDFTRKSDSDGSVVYKVILNTGLSQCIKSESDAVATDCALQVNATPEKYSVTVKHHLQHDASEKVDSWEPLELALETEDSTNQSAVKILGGLSTVDTNDDSVDSVFKYALSQYQLESNKETLPDDLAVVKASKQIVAGIKYILDAESIKDESKYLIEVIEQPWMVDPYALIKFVKQPSGDATIDVSANDDTDTPLTLPKNPSNVNVNLGTELTENEMEGETGNSWEVIGIAFGVLLSAVLLISTAYARLKAKVRQRELNTRRYDLLNEENGSDEDDNDSDDDVLLENNP